MDDLEKLRLRTQGAKERLMSQIEIRLEDIKKIADGEFNNSPKYKSTVRGLANAIIGLYLIYKCDVEEGIDNV